MGGASAGVTLQAVGPALLQAVAALLLAVAEGPALLQAVAGLLLAVAVGPALLQAVAALLLAVAVGPALLQAAAALKLSILLYLEHSNIPIPYIVLFRCSFFITLRGTAPVNSEAIGTIAVL